jgi:hypothetical protein
MYESQAGQETTSRNIRQHAIALEDMTTGINTIFEAFSQEQRYSPYS